MSDDILNFQSFHPFKATKSNICRGVRYNSIDSQSGVLVSVADKEIYFYDINTYEELTISSKLRRDKLIDVESFFKLNCGSEIFWVEFNCSASYLLIATLTNNNHLNSIKIIDVQKTLNERKEFTVCDFKPDSESKLVDLKWHPNENDSLLLVLNDNVHLCQIKETAFVIMHSRPNAFCVSWSPKGKQFSVLMRKDGTKNFVVNQYDSNMIEKRSTEIIDAMNEFKVTFDLIPIEICWYATYSFIIGFRGDTNGDEQFRIYVCKFAIKTQKIQILPDVRSSTDCINPNPGPYARLYYLHILDWKVIILVNNTAENAVAFEYDSNDDLHVIGTYCLPIEGNIVGISCDYTSNKTILDSWLSSAVEQSGSNPILFLKLSNAECFGNYLRHTDKRILNNKKMLIKGISSGSIDSNMSVSADQSVNLINKFNTQVNVSEKCNQDNLLTQTNLISKSEIISITETQKPIPTTSNPLESQNLNKSVNQFNLFVTKNHDKVTPQSNLFVNFIATTQSTIFTSSKPKVSITPSTIISTSNKEKDVQPFSFTNVTPTSKPSILGTFPSKPLGTQDLDNSQSNLLAKVPGITETSTSIFNISKQELSAAQSTLASTSNTEVNPCKSNNLFGNHNQNTIPVQSSLFSTQNSDSSSQVFKTTINENKSLKSSENTIQNQGKPNSNIPGNFNKNLSNSNTPTSLNINIPVAKGLQDHAKNIAQTSLNDTNAVKLIENKKTPINNNLQKLNSENQGKPINPDIKKENTTTQQISKITNDKNSNKGDMIDVFLPNALQVLEERINGIKRDTKNVIEKSRQLTNNSEMNKDISNMFRDLEKNMLDVNNVITKNKQIIEDSKRLFQDIEITLEFTIRFKDAILDSQINHRLFKSAPNPLLKKTSLNLGELFKKVNLHLNDLEEALDYEESKKNNFITKSDNKKQLEDINRTLKSNIKVISLERFKIDLIKDHINDTYNETNEFPYSSLQTKYVNKEMEKHLHALISRRPVNNISCKLPETKQCLKNKKPIKTPIKHNVVSNKLPNESIKTEPKSLTSKPVIIKLVEKNSYKFNQDSQDSINSNKFGTILPSNSENDTKYSFKGIANKLENLDSENSNQDFEIKSKTVAISTNSSKINNTTDILSKNSQPINEVNITTQNTSLSRIFSNVSKSSDIQTISLENLQSDSNQIIQTNNILPPINSSSTVSSNTSSSINTNSHFKLQSPVSSPPSALFSISTTEKQNDLFINSSANTQSSCVSQVKIPTTQTSGIFSNISSSSAFTPNSNVLTTTLMKTTTQPIGIFSTTLSSGLFSNSSSSTSIQNSNIFSPSSTAISSQVQSIFSSSVATKPINDLFNCSVTTQNTNLFASSISSPTEKQSELSGVSTLNQQNLFGSSNNSTANISSSKITTTATVVVRPSGLFSTPTSTKPISGLFSSSLTTTSQSVLNTSTSTKSSSNLFGNSDVSTQNTNLFASAITTATTQSNLFGNSKSSISNSVAFTTSATMTSQSIFSNSTSNKPIVNIFNNSSNVSNQSTGLFGSTISTTAVTATKDSSELFTTTVSSNQNSGLFGNSNTSTGLFGTPVSKSSQNGGLFGNGSSSNITSIFSSPNTSQSTEASGGLFGNSNQSGNATQSTGLFGTVTSNKSNNQLFGNSNPSTQSTGLFGKSANIPSSGGLFGNSKVSNQALGSGNLFGSPANNSSPSSGLFGNTSVNEGLFGNKSSTTPSTGFFGKNAPTPNSNLFSSSNQNNQSSSSSIFGPSTPQTSIFSSNKTGTQQPENISGLSLVGSTFMSGLGSNQLSNNNKNIFGTPNKSTSTPVNTNLFDSKTHSNTPNLFNSDAKPNSLFGNNAVSPQSSLFGSRPAFGSANENSSQTGGLLFSTSVFGNSSDSQMTFGDMATNNVSQSGFGINSNQPGNIFQRTTSSSFTQRRM